MKKITTEMDNCTDDIKISLKDFPSKYSKKKLEMNNCQDVMSPGY
jgi:hypothetical protein